MDVQSGVSPAQRRVSRREQCAIDARKVKESSISSKLSGFEVVENSDNVELHFRAVVGQDMLAVSICCSEDYPDGTLVTVEQHDPEYMRATVAEAVCFVRGQLQQQSSPSTSGTGSLAHLTEPDEISDSDVDDDDDDDENMMEDNPLHVAEVNKQLLHDLEELRSFYGDAKCAIFNHYSGLDHADIFLLLSCASLPKLAIEAWGLSADEPIVIKLSEVDVSLYRSTTGYPKVETFVQSKQDKKSAVTRQLEFIIDKFMAEQWRIMRSTSDENVFVMLLNKVMSRLPTLNDHCVLCDEEQQFKGMLMPTVCLNNLCVFRYETLGLMADVAVLSAQHEVIDLLFEFLRAACFSQRSHLILDPYPTVRDPYSTGADPVLAFDRENGTLGVQRLREVLVDVKCRRRLALGDYEYVSSHAPKLLMSTVQWMVSSNRAFLVKLAEHRRIDILGNCRQFLMLTDSPAKEAAFQEAKALAGGSTFLFHGSSFDNWHSILRKGLLVASGTKYQLHGAAYGTGIYLSDQLSMSYTYAARMMGYGGGISTGVMDIVCCDDACCTQDAKRFLRTTTAVVAVCEVIKTDALKKHGSNHIYTLNNADHCCTRFLLVFEGHEAPSVELDDKTCDILRTAVAEHSML